MAACPGSTEMHSPVAASQMRTVLSEDPDTTRVPSERTPPTSHKVCPSKGPTTHSPDAASQMRTVLSKIRTRPACRRERTPPSHIRSVPVQKDRLARRRIPNAHRLVPIRTPACRRERTPPTQCARPKTTTHSPDAASQMRTVLSKIRTRPACRREERHRFTSVCPSKGPTTHSPDAASQMRTVLS